MASVKKSIDLNADVGEGFPWDEQLLRLVTSANICCGAHAGNRATIARALEISKWNDVVVGAHPGYADRENFGRVPRDLGEDELLELIIQQVEYLESLAGRVGVRVRYLKPHGALYHQAQVDEKVAETVAVAASALEMPVVGLPFSEMQETTECLKVRIVAEGFVERRYDASGHLLPRTSPLAMHDDPALIMEQTRFLLGVKDAVDSAEIEQEFKREGWARCAPGWERVETLCIHGDRPQAVAIAELVRSVAGFYDVKLRAFV